MTGRVTRLRGALLAALLLVSPCRIALAQETDEGAARGLFREGLALHEARDFAGAIKKYRAAYARWKNPKILTNIGTSAWELGRFAEAANAYDRFLADAPPDANRAEVEKALSDVLPKVGTIEVVTGGKNASITLDGQPLDIARLDRLHVEPGTHKLQADMAGVAPEQQVVNVAAGATVRVEFKLESKPGSAAAGSAGAAGSGTDAAVESTRARPHRASLPWVFGGLGAASLVASGVFFLMRNGEVDDLEGECIDGVCPARSQDSIDKANRYGTLSLVTLGLGVAGVGTGIVLFTQSRNEVAAPLRVHVAASPASAKVTAQVRF
jgi:hypothetical protein